MKRILIIIALIYYYSSTLTAGGIVNTFTLDNGLRVLHREMKENPIVSIMFFSPSGSIAETPQEAGLANLTQMLMFQGTKTKSSEELARQVEDIGANINSNMEDDFISLGLSCLSNHSEEACSILNDVLENPTFPAQELEKEKTNVLAGLKGRKDHIFQYCDDSFLKAFYGDHPYSWPELGKEELIKKFTREDLVSWHKKYFNANNLVLAVGGDISLEKTRELALKYFSHLSTGSSFTYSATAKYPKRQTIIEREKKFEQAFLMIGFPAPAVALDGYASLKVTNALLGGRMSGRLFMELREKLGLGYEVNSFYGTKRDLSRFVVYIGLDPANVEIAKKKIFEILDNLKTETVSKKELEETKNYIRGIYALDRQTIERKVWYMGWWEVLGPGLDYDLQYLTDILKVNSDDIKVAANLFFNEYYVQVEVLPQNNQ